MTGLSFVYAYWRFWKEQKIVEPSAEAGDQVILSQFPLDFQWPVQEPFIFCVHHDDAYPQGMKNLGPDPKFLTGRDMGQDFTPKDGFRMYHGQEVPGFPVHPHRGFETITIVRKGYVDHADSLGAAGRYGEGDVQWMTAGAGVQHSEMFPLLKQDGSNTLELFQIWLNLPKRSKMVPAHFKMFWSEKIPQLKLDDNKVTVSLIAGSMEGAVALAPPPDSWAADSQNEVLILLVKMQAGSRLVIPGSRVPTNRSLYFFAGKGLRLEGKDISSAGAYFLNSQVSLNLNTGSEEVEFLLLQARPIGEPIVQHGPFVMNSKEEIMKTIRDFQQSEFGGWRWPRRDMTHGPSIERFAKFPDGRTERPKS